jgi:hypothetical protein
MNQCNAIIIALISLALHFTSSARAADGPELSTQWKGRGSIQVETPIVAPGEEVRLKYSIAESKGSAAEVNLVVVSPSGWTLVKQDSLSLPEGSGSITFKLNAGGEKGKYIVFSYWYIQGHGVDGPTCLAHETFQVK